RQEHATAVKLSETVFAPANCDSLKDSGQLRIWEYQQGYLALRQGRADEALQHFRTALQQHALDWYIDSYEDCLANAYLEQGRADEAIAEYERILKINSRYPLAAYHLAQAYERKGDRVQARAAYEQFLRVWQEADTDIPEVRDTRARLQ